MASSLHQDHDFPVLVNGFSNIASDDEATPESSLASRKYWLHWYCAPDSWPVDDSEKREGRDGKWNVDAESGALIVAPPAKKDFWRKTYYTPTLVKDDGPCLFAALPDTLTVMAETRFTIARTEGQLRQFDQAGICVRLDSEHWLKTGIEVVDDVPRLSCVCTNSYSDWSTQKYWKPTATDVRIRVHVLLASRRSIVVEAWDGQSWQFIRICHLSAQANVDPDPMANDSAVLKAWSGRAAPKGHVYIGVFAACPEDQTGTIVTFHEFTVVEGSTFQHDADGNNESAVET